MAMTRENLYGILDLLEREMEFHKTVCVNASNEPTDCNEATKHAPYRRYCIKEIALYAGVPEVVMNGNDSL